MNIVSKRFANNVAVLAATLNIGMLITAAPAMAARLKDVADVKGVRENILIGYGIVVGLKGSGDSSAEVTSQSLGRLFEKLGLDVKNPAGIKSKNAAAVIVTSKLPAFARAGNKIDITVSSIGDASSLEGGTLLVTPLRAGDQNIYAVAQGSVSIGSIADGTTKNFPTVGRVVMGATVEKDVDTNFSQKRSVRMTLHSPDFTTAARLAVLINGELGGKYASARDSATIDVVVPFNYAGNSVEFLAAIENINVNVDTKAKVVLNERTGTVVMGDRITITPVAIAHGDLSIQVGGTGGAAGKNGRVAELKSGSSVSDLVKALNALGVQPKDLTSIFQTLKSMGALQAELEIL
ncbi:MAG: flagellar basal body P-ring protein FlgI [Cryobacterium sp.]|nr:flagellar basal body P-ring protein FlgI [Oligoflexia bacterium]